MPRMEAPPFKRGETFSQDNGTAVVPTPAVNDFLGGFNYEGMEFEWMDSELPNGGYGTGINVRCRVVRNSTGIAVKPGQLVTLNSIVRVLDGATVLPGTGADAIARTTALHCFPADEFLQPAGVPNGDLFYVVVSGPCLVTTAATGTPTVAVDQKVVSGTMAGTTSVDAGCVVVQDVTGATTALSAQIQNAVGRAMSALTVNQTSTPLLINVGW